MAAIDHQGGLQFGAHQVFACCIDTGFIVIGRFAAAQNHMAIGVALGLHNRHLAVLVNRQKVVTPLCGLNRVGGNLDVAIGAIFKANGGRQT